MPDRHRSFSDRGKKVKYVAPGEEEISGNAQQAFRTRPQEAEKEGNFRGARSRLILTFLRKYSKDALGSRCHLFGRRSCFEFERDYMKSANTYRLAGGEISSSPNFDEKRIEGPISHWRNVSFGKEDKAAGNSDWDLMDRCSLKSSLRSCGPQPFWLDILPEHSSISAWPAETVCE